MIERDSKQSELGKQGGQKEWDDHLAGPRGSTAAAYDTARMAQAESEGVPTKNVVNAPGHNAVVSSSPDHPTLPMTKPVAREFAKGTEGDYGYDDADAKLPAAENARSMKAGDGSSDGGRRATMEDERDPADIENIRSSDVDAKRFSR